MDGLCHFGIYTFHLHSLVISSHVFSSLENIRLVKKLMTLVATFVLLRINPL